MKKIITGLSTLAIGLALFAAAPSTFAEPVGPPHECCYYNGEIFRTVAPPSAMPNEGRDTLYSIPGQLGVTAVAPGTKGYHGGAWAVHEVTWNVTPYLLTSEAEVLVAAEAGDITITRVPEADFRCPLQR
jgi:hypothetical protein